MAMIQTRFDVDVLLDEPTFSSPVIYRYRTGILKPKIIEMLDRIVKPGRDGLHATHPLEFAGKLLGGTLFDQFVPICDWPLRKSNDLKAASTGILSVLGSPDTTSGVLFARADDAIFDGADWAEVATRCMVIDEPMATTETVDRLLDYCFATTSLPNCRMAQSEVRGFFRDILREEGALDLNQFFRLFDEEMLISCDDQGAFIPPGESEALAHKRSYIASALRRLIKEQQTSAIDEFVSGIEVRLRREDGSPRKTYNDVCDLTNELIVSAQDARSSSEDKGDVARTKINCALWAILLLVWGQRLFEAVSEDKTSIISQTDPTLRHFDHLSRDLPPRTVSTDLHNPFADLWPEVIDLAKAYALDVLTPRSAARDRMIVSLASLTAQLARESSRLDWIARISLVLETAVAQRRITNETAA